MARRTQNRSWSWSPPDWMSTDSGCRNRQNGTICGPRIRRRRCLHVGMERRWLRVGHVPGKTLG